MATCHNCQNLLPRTVDRCPVCGLAPLPDPVDTSEVVVDSTPAWAMPEQPEVPGFSDDPFAQHDEPVGSPTLSPDEFLEEFHNPAPFSEGAVADAPALDPFGPNAARDWPTADPSVTAPLSRGPSPAENLRNQDEQAPSLPDYQAPLSAEQLASEQTEFQDPEQPGLPDSRNLNAATDELDASRPVPPAPGTDTTADLDSMQSPPVDGVDPTITPHRRVVAAPSVAAAALDDGPAHRVVRAASNRVEGDFLIGKRPRHEIAVGLAALTALFLVVAGAAAASMAPDPDTTLAYTDEPSINSSATAVLDEGVAEQWLEARAGAFVTFELNGCGVDQPSGLRGVAVDERTVLVAATPIETDPTPIIVDASGTRHTAKTVGVLTGTDLAILRLDTPLDDHFLWGSATLIAEGSEVRVAGASSGDVSVQLSTIEQKRRTSDGITGMDLTTRAAHGSVVLDDDDLIIGVVARSGTFAADAADVSSLVSRAVLNPTDVAPVCPAPLEPEESELDQVEETEG